MWSIRTAVGGALMALARLPLVPASWLLHGPVRNLVFALQRVPPARFPAPGALTTGYGNVLPPVVHRTVSHSELKDGRLIFIGESRTVSVSHAAHIHLNKLMLVSC